MIGNDAIFKHAYEELYQNDWSKEEMQKNTQQDAEEKSGIEEIEN